MLKNTIVVLVAYAPAHPLLGAMLAILVAMLDRLLATLQLLRRLHCSFKRQSLLASPPNQTPPNQTPPNQTTNAKISN